MRLEESPVHHLHSVPPVEDDPERLLTTVLRNAVEDFSTSQPIAEKLAEHSGNEEVEKIVGYWKQALVERLEETVQVATDNLLADLEELQTRDVSGESPDTTPPLPPAAGHRTDPVNRLE